MYEVHQEHGASMWSVTLNSNGLIEDAENRPGAYALLQGDGQ